MVCFYADFKPTLIGDSLIIAAELSAIIFDLKLAWAEGYMFPSGDSDSSNAILLPEEDECNSLHP